MFSDRSIDWISRFRILKVTAFQRGKYSLKSAQIGFPASSNNNDATYTNSCLLLAVYLLFMGFMLL